MSERGVEVKQIEEAGRLLVDKKTELSAEISKGLNERYTSFLKDTSLQDETIVQWRANLIEYIGDAMINNNVESVEEKVTDWARQTGEGAVQYNIKIDELLITIKYYRTVIWNLLEKNLDKDKVTFDTFLRIDEILDYILHHVSYMFSTTFVEFHNRSIQLAHEEVVAVSTPIVSLSDNVAVLPLIGELDTYRAQVLLDSALEKCSELENADLIIDLSGVPIVDTAVANELIELANALQLIGVRVTFTGIRPEIAQTMVQLGLNFKDVRTAASLKNALNMPGINLE